MSKKNAKNTATRGPGRPKATVKWPNKKFTLADAVELNNPLTKLTVTKHLKADAKRMGKSLVVRLAEKREPASADGLGRKAFVYVLRSRLDALKNARAVSVNIGSKPHAKATRKPKASTLTKATQTYEDIKAALTAPTPAVTPDPAPVPADPVPPIPVPEPTSESAPTADATTPVAEPVAATAEPVPA